MDLCNGASFFDLADSCIRETWLTLLPVVVVFAICLLPTFGRVLSWFGNPFKTYLTVEEAEALDVDTDAKGGDFGDADVDVENGNQKTRAAKWRKLLFVGVGWFEFLAWVAVSLKKLVGVSHDPTGFYFDVAMALAWGYTAIRSMARPIVTAPFDLFALYLVFFIQALVRIGEWLYARSIGLEWGTGRVDVMNLDVILVLLWAVLSMPLNAPSSRDEQERVAKNTSPEDSTTLFQWITFSWIFPLIKRGRQGTLNQSDVWNLSPTMRSRPLFIKFTTFRQSTLVRRLIAANALDIFLDVSLTATSVLMTYSGPFFLKKILDLLDLKNPTPEAKTRAYVYASLAFVCTLLRAEADLLHLWFSRRASTRVRSELMAAIYDKALKRKDLSGTVKKDDAKKGGADLGKVVNLMAGDAESISFFVAASWFMYGTPFELVLASVFLYQLLGWSAFAGLICLALGWPINRYITARTHKIAAGTAAARDKRMGVVAEMVAAIKPIKFFAWEDHWVSRVMAARAEEIKWMVKGRINGVCFQLLWSCAPVAVSVVALFVYVYQGNELTVGKAFTSLTLFAMVKRPLSVVPIAIVQFTLIGVAVNRIATYLEEDEVDGQVSSLKKYSPSSPELNLRSYPHGNVDPVVDEDVAFGLGIIDGTFQWNGVADDTNAATSVPVPQVGASSSKGKGKDTSTSHDQPSVTQHGHGASSSTITIAVAKSTSHGVDIESTATIVRDSAEDDDELVPEEKFKLRGINVVFPEGKLSVVTGPTASGKTALLTALLGELTTLSGHILLPKSTSKVDENGYTHSISYAAQTPWLQHQSIKDNILFGSPYDEVRYLETVECCALNPDFEALEDGDSTEIGVRGVSLSGGQKARVALARAVYARTKFVLLDDPLSAVDSHTARFLFDRLFCGPLLKDRTVVLVTHHVGLVLPGTHYLIRMLHGRIDTQGTVSDLKSLGVLDDIKHQDEAPTDVKVESGDVAEKLLAEDIVPGDQGKKVPRKLVEEEHRETGNIKWHVYHVYLKASSYWIWTIILLIVLANQLLGVAEKLWAKTWGEAYGSDASFGMTVHPFQSLDVLGTANSETYLTSVEGGQHPMQFQNLISSNITSLTGTVSPQIQTFWDLPNANEHPVFFVAVYAGIGFATALVGILLMAVVYTGALRASRIIFRGLLETVVRATFRFHDTTPQGRLLNRFGKDIATVDSSLHLAMQGFITSLAGFIVAVLTVAVVFPAFLVPAIVLGFFYYNLSVSYLRIGRDLRRMESNSKSPIFSDFGEVLEGIVTVRAFAAERRFLNGIHKKIDDTTQMTWMYWMANRWLGFNFDVLGAFAVLITMILSIATLHSGAGLAGLCITSAMTFTTSVYWACRAWTELELNLNSVERVIEYLELPQEPPSRLPGHEVPAHWPSTARNESLLSVENLVVKYAPDLPPVLQNVSFDLRAGERVGLLGRTGSGKSTLAMSLLRFVDPSEGKILIDGIDISTIGLYDLRSRLTFIPQDATLFSGTLKENVDPFDEHTDAECLDVLRRVQIIGSTPESTTLADASIINISSSSSSLPTDAENNVILTLDSKVSAGGTNFSQGQRQLVAMARAMLKRSSIIVLDEATSSIDFKTDAKIQQTIRQEFTDSLLLTVAHRLHTVIDYDRLVVLDQGQVAEFDTPLNLILKEGGIFRQMCLKSGAYAELYALAEAKKEE